MSLSYKGTSSYIAIFSVFCLGRAACNSKNQQDINKSTLAWVLSPKDSLKFLILGLKDNMAFTVPGEGDLEA